MSRAADDPLPLPLPICSMVTSDGAAARTVTCPSRAGRLASPQPRCPRAMSGSDRARRWSVAGESGQERVRAVLKLRRTEDERTLITS
jgi:hypothetical protein